MNMERESMQVENIGKRADSIAERGRDRNWVQHGFVGNLCVQISGGQVAEVRTKVSYCCT